MAVSYWLDLFTYQTWTEFFEVGADVSGFRQKRWNTVKQMKPGDVLKIRQICRESHRGTG